MNLWECSWPGCTVTATGVGGAVGLVAIGWYFRKGSVGAPMLLCPVHYLDTVPCAESPTNGQEAPPCSLCAAKLQARRQQQIIEST